MNLDQQYVTRSPPIGKRIWVRAIEEHFVTCDIKESHSLKKLANVIVKPRATGCECKTERWKTINEEIVLSLPDKEFSLKCTFFLREPLIRVLEKKQTKRIPHMHISCKKQTAKAEFAVAGRSSKGKIS